MQRNIIGKFRVTKLLNAFGLSLPTPPPPLANPPAPAPFHFPFQIPPAVPQAVVAPPSNALQGYFVPYIPAHPPFVPANPFAPPFPQGPFTFEFPLLRAHAVPDPFAPWRTPHLYNLPNLPMDHPAIPENLPAPLSHPHAPIPRAQALPVPHANTPQIETIPDSPVAPEHVQHPVAPPSPQGDVSPATLLLTNADVFTSIPDEYQ